MAWVWKVSRGLLSVFRFIVLNVWMFKKYAAQTELAMVLFLSEVSTERNMKVYANILLLFSNECNYRRGFVHWNIAKVRHVCSPSLLTLSTRFIIRLMVDFALCWLPISNPSKTDYNV